MYRSFDWSRREEAPSETWSNAADCWSCVSTVWSSMWSTIGDLQFSLKLMNLDEFCNRWWSSMFRVEHRFSSMINFTDDVALFIDVFTWFHRWFFLSGTRWEVSVMNVLVTRSWRNMSPIIDIYCRVAKVSNSFLSCSHNVHVSDSFCVWYIGV